MGSPSVVSAWSRWPQQTSSAGTRRCVERQDCKLHAGSFPGLLPVGFTAVPTGRCSGRSLRRAVLGDMSSRAQKENGEAHGILVVPIDMGWALSAAAGGHPGRGLGTEACYVALDSSVGFNR